MNRVGTLILAVGLPLLIGAIGSFFTTSEISTWYATLNKPSFNPPSFIFAPVWTTLYILMGIALFLVISNKGQERRKRTAFMVFGAQILLNLLWSIIFFRLHQPLFAFLEIVVLWAAILYTIIIFYKISKPAAYLLIPYILWVSFASLLNLYVVLLN